MTENLPADVGGRAIAREAGALPATWPAPLRQLSAMAHSGIMSDPWAFLVVIGDRRLRCLSDAEAVTTIWLIADVTWVTLTVAA
jgi:hypothetical protein